MRSRIRTGAAVLMLAFPLTNLAHRLDEYLQASRLSLAEDGIVVKLDLTPGVDVAPMIFALINTDRDGRISPTEGLVYANQVLKETVLEIDGKRQRLDLVSSAFPSFQEMSAGTGVIRIEARPAWTAVPGRHSLFYRNNHRPDLGIYLVNALVPASRRFEITSQHRDPLQREFRLDFTVAGTLSQATLSFRLGHLFD